MALDEKTISAVSELLNPIKEPVELELLVSDDCGYCDIVEEMLEGIKKTGKIDFRKKKHPGLSPTVAFKKFPGIQFTGVPSGHEFRTFLETILMVDSGKTGLNDGTRNELAKIKKKVEIKVFVTPTCPYCPTAVFTAHQMAAENENITSTMIEATEFPELVREFQVSGVPKTVINDKVGFEGSAPEHVFIKKILEAL